MDSISSVNTNAVDTSLLNVGQQQASQAVQGVNTESAQVGETSSALNLISDEANISPEAKAAYQQDQIVQSYARLAQQTPSSNSDKVAQLKSQFDSGNIGSYLSSLNSDTLAGNLLSSPVGSFLQSAEIA